MTSNSEKPDSLRELKGFYITRCQKGSGLQLKTPSGEIIYFMLLKTSANGAELALKSNKFVQIKKID